MEDEVVAETVGIYPTLSEEEKATLFEVIRSFGDQGYDFRLYYEFFCLHFYKDKRYADDILECLLSYDMEYTRRLNYCSVLAREMFLAGIMVNYAKCVELESLIVKEIKDKLSDIPDYIPYSERNSKSVVIVIKPFLGEYHSPSLQTINLGNYMRQLGYDTFYLSYCENGIFIKYGHDICSPFVRNTLYEGTGAFEYECFDTVIKGFHSDLHVETMAEDLNALAERILEINPVFVIGIEGYNILADLCASFTDVICMNVVDDLPVTLSPYVLRYFPGEYRNRYINAADFNRTVFDAKYDNELMPYNDEDGEKIELDAARFNICIMGNRLDDEIDEDMRALIRRLLEKVPETFMLFIGDCPGTKEKLHDVADRCRFAGYVKRCEDAVAACNLFLNPPRKGGGGGGYMAIKRGIPVYTLTDCDVASCVGAEFEHESYDELIPFVQKCLEDKGYYDEMCRLSQGNYNKRYKIDSLGNVSKFCEEFTKQISGCN